MTVSLLQKKQDLKTYKKRSKWLWKKTYIYIKMSKTLLKYERSMFWLKNKNSEFVNKNWKKKNFKQEIKKLNL